MLKRNYCSFLLLMALVSACSLSDDDGVPNKNHSVNFRNDTRFTLYISFSADSRLGGTDPFFVTRDSTFVLPVGESFEMINDSYDAGSSEPAYEFFHDPSVIAERIHSLAAFRVEGGDTTYVSFDLLNEDRWNTTSNDPITFEPAYHYYLYAIEGADF